MLLYETTDKVDKLVDMAEQDEERVRVVGSVDEVDAIADLIDCKRRDFGANVVW